MPKVNQKFRNNESGNIYRVIDVSDGEVVATMNPNDDGEIGTSMSWLSPLQDFVLNFSPVK